MPDLITYSSEETATLGAKTGEHVQAGDIIVLSGDLGAGKTQFAGGLARALDIGGPITSPTFNVMKVYEAGHIPLYHFDLYRLDNAEQLQDLDFYEVLRPGFPGVALIEWGVLFGEVAEKADLTVTLRMLDAGERAIELSAHTPRGEELLKAVANA